MTTEEELELFSSPFSGTFFQSSDGLLPSNRLLACVFVPFIGDFFQLLLSVSYLMVSMFSSPLSGTFFNPFPRWRKLARKRQMFSSPLSGTFFNPGFMGNIERSITVFVPFIGDFFQSRRLSSLLMRDSPRFRPLYRGLFSIVDGAKTFPTASGIFVPFIGDFFQSTSRRFISWTRNYFRPLYRGLFSIDFAL